MIRAIIVDDEKGAIESLKTDLKWYCEDEIELLGAAQNLTLGLELVEKKSPDLVFLDIEIGKENGFMLLTRLERLENAPAVIFTTGHAGYAIEALRKRAFDYLLKPIDPDELVATIARLKESLQGHEAPANKPGNASPATIALPMQDQIRICRLDEIIRCESERNYTRFHLRNDESLLVASTMGNFDAQLTQNGFFRPHKSHIINLSDVKSYIRTEGGYIQMQDGSQIPVSRNHKAALFEILGIS